MTTPPKPQETPETDAQLRTILEMNILTLRDPNVMLSMMERCQIANDLEAAVQKDQADEKLLDQKCECGHVLRDHHDDGHCGHEICSCEHFDVAPAAREKEER